MGLDRIKAKRRCERCGELLPVGEAVPLWIITATGAGGSG